MNEMIMWSPGVSLEDIEKQVILRAYKHFRENKTVTSNALGIAIRTLDSKLEKYAADAKELERRHEDARNKRAELQRRARGLPAGQQNGLISQSGLHMESAAKAPAQHAVPLPERQEVQGLSSKTIAASNPKRNR